MCPPVWAGTQAGPYAMAQVAADLRIARINVAADLRITRINVAAALTRINVAADLRVRRWAGTQAGPYRIAPDRRRSAISISV